MLSSKSLSVLFLLGILSINSIISSAYAFNFKDAQLTSKTLSNASVSTASKDRETLSNFIIVGSFSSNGIGFPISYKSIDGGKTWTAATMSAKGSGLVELKGLSCDRKKQKCVVVGRAVNNVDSPISYTTLDGGETWLSSSQIPLPNDVFSARLNDVSCTHAGECVAVGSYNNAELQQPIVYTSKDRGRHWKISRVFDISGGAGFSSIACSADGNQCIAIGTNIGPYDTVPFGYNTTDGGQTWSATGFPKPKYYNEPINAVTCGQDGMQCLAAGMINGEAGVYYSDNGGRHFKSDENLPAVNEVSELTKIRCTSSGSCVAIGYKGLRPSHQSTSISYISNDNGSHWQFSAEQPPIQNDSDYLLKDIACNSNGTLCIAVGQVNGETWKARTPLAYLSNNGGKSWNRINLPNIGEYGQLGAVR